MRRALPRARHVALLALLGTAVAVPAFAQSSAPAGGGGGPASASGAASVYPQCATTPTKAESDKAHSAYLLGKSSFDEGDYASAITMFKEAYRRDCTKHELL